MQSNRTVTYQMDKALKLLTSASCVVEAMSGASRVNLIRNLETGGTIVEPSDLKSFKYVREGFKEELRGVRLEHSFACPALDKQMTNPNKPLRLCCCILLKQGNKCLATKRTSGISFPGAWVLPGGGVQNNETVFEAGLRECLQQVGREFSPKEAESLAHNSDDVMVWQSHYVKDNHVHRGNFVVFITIPTESFPVKVQEEQVQEYKWVDIRQACESVIYNEKDRQGFAQGHIRYFKLLQGLLQAQL